MQRPKEIALALLAGALITGGALGFAAGHLLDARADAPGAPGAMRHYIASQLDLSPTQVAQLDSILDDRRRVMTKIAEPVKPQLDSARAAARKQIMGILNPEQQKRFQEILQEQDRAAEANRK
jgi:Spy/CpxP family protein refolding chaperone